jgi:hypothetical protein
MLDTALDLQHDIILLRRAMEIANEADALSQLSAAEAAAISAETARLWTVLTALTERLARIR